MGITVIGNQVFTKYQSTKYIVKLQSQQNGVSNKNINEMATITEQNFQQNYTHNSDLNTYFLSLSAPSWFLAKKKKKSFFLEML